MPTLKTIDLKVLDGTLEISDPINAGEEVVITVDFTGCEVDAWAKWLDVRLYNGTGAPISLGTDVICTYTLPREMMLRGRIEFQPHVILGEETIKYDVKALTVNRSLQVVEDTVNYDPTVLGTLETAISGLQVETASLELDKMEKDGSNSDVITLTFDNGTTVSIDNDRQIANVAFPDGTTANIPSELWYSQGKATEAIAEGDNVMLAGSQGAHYLVKKAVASELATSPHLYLGVATKSSATNGWVKITKWGLVNNINMNGWAYGTQLYYDPVTGGFTATMPSLPNARIKVGMVVRTGVNTGVFLVDVADITLYTNTEIDALLATKSPVGHTHDDRYYTETETNTLLSGKSNTSHLHDDRYYTESETDTLLTGKSDVGHNHDDRYFTETEVGVLLSGKSDTSHTHDGRYYTETETDALLSGKSDTTHNHDLTYAPIVHNHDDLYYTDDEVDTLLLSKSDTTHTHDLIKNATEANAKIEASSTGAVITRNVNDANTALKVNQQQGTGNIAQFQFGGTSKVNITKYGEVQSNYFSNPSGIAKSQITLGDGTLIDRNVADANPALKVNQANASSTGNVLELQSGGSIVARVDRFGGIYAPVMYSLTNINNAYIGLNTTGTLINRNQADANTALTVNQQHASSTGKILDLQFGGMSVANVDKTGNIGGTALYVGLNGGIFGSMIAQGFNLGSTVNRPRIYRNVADALPAITIDQQNASSTGNIAEFQFNGTTKLAIDKNGLIPQEAWIAPTLLNGWVAFSGSLANAQYFKDQMGFVHLRGIVKSGTNGYIFSLPPGYRPAKSVYVATVSNGVFAYLVIDSTGGVNATAYSNLWVSLENVIFRAEL